MFLNTVFSLLYLMFLITLYPFFGIDFGKQFDGINIFGYSLSNHLGIVHRQDYSGGAVYDITSGKDSFAGGHSIRIVARDDISLVVNLYSFGGGYNTAGWFRAYCHKYYVDMFCALFACVFDDDFCKPVTLITAELGYLCFPIELYALFNSFFVFGMVGAHLIDGVMINYLYV